MKAGDPKLDAIVKRPVKQLAQITGAWRPHLWGHYDQVRNEHKARAEWPSWCYAPISVARACLDPLSNLRTTIESGGLIGAVAMASWRLTKGIYIFDETMFDALWATEVKGDLPIELLQRLPEWCVYVPFPSRKLFPRGVTSTADTWVYGFFGCLDWQNGSVWLHFCLDADTQDPAVPIQLETISVKLEGSLADACLPFRREIQKEMVKTPGLAPSVAAGIEEWLNQQETMLIQPLMSILLWLCSAKPEISGLDPLRGFRTKKTKQGIRHFNAEQPRVYEVAYRIGAALRLDAEAMVRGGRGDGTHASPRPHIRRAHWHAFWTGPRAAAGKEQPTERKLILKWIAPIAVCVGTNDPIIPTVHPVLGSVAGGA